VKFLNLGCGANYSSSPEWTNIDLHGGHGVLKHNLYDPLPFEDGEFNAVYHSDVLEHLNKRFAPLFMRECWRVVGPGGILRVAVPDMETICRIYLYVLEDALKDNEAAQTIYEWVMVELLDQMTRHKSGGEMLNYWKQNPVPAYDFVISRVGSEAARAIASMHKRGAQPDLDPGSLTADESFPQAVGQFRLSGQCHLWMYDRYSLGKLFTGAGFSEIRVCQHDESAIPDFNSYLLDIEADGTVRKPDSFYMEGRKS
jgi:predicted SAM-dependent methyltransferase